MDLRRVATTSDDGDDTHVHLPVLRDPDSPWDWHEDAACRKYGRGTDAFFSKGVEAIRRGKVICSVCTVREECLDFALRNKEPDGIWGGLTAPERKRYVAETLGGG